MLLVDARFAPTGRTKPMSITNAVLLDNTTIDSAARILSREEILRRQAVGWCLRDLSDLACLSTLLDALAYFDNIYLLPENIIPSTEHIGSLEARKYRTEFRKYTTVLPLGDQQIEIIKQNSESFFDDLNEITLRQLSVPSLGRSKYFFHKDSTGKLDIYPDKSSISFEETSLSIRRAVLYLFARSVQEIDPNLILWLSPERFLVAKRLSLSQVEMDKQHKNFNEALSGKSEAWIAVAPMLLYFLKAASDKSVIQFSDWLIDEINLIRKDSRVGQIRSLFNKNLQEPVDRKYIEKWSTYGEIRNKIEDTTQLIPEVGSVLQLVIKWFQEPVLKLLGGVVNWNSDSRSLVRNVANEIRYLQIDSIRDLVIKSFASPEGEQRHYYAHKLDHCASAFLSILAGRNSEFASNVTIQDSV